TRVLDETVELAKADAASIHMCDVTKKDLTLVGYLRRDAQEACVLSSTHAIALDDPQNPIAHAASEGTTVRADLAAADVDARAWLGDESTAIGRDHIGLIAIPLRDRAGDVDGVLSLMS